MKTFHEFLNEDFNSNGATQFTLQVNDGFGKDVPISVFFEEVPAKPFNLNRYMKSFGSTAKDIMKNKSDGWRGIVFHKTGKFLIFVWSDHYLHYDICKILEKQKGTYPSYRYLRAYNNTYLLSPKEEISSEWCFPFFFSSSKLDHNLISNAMNELIAQKGIDKLFMI